MVDLVMVYDADGGLAGELRYVIGHLRGTAECSLCDISHGRLRRKPEFVDMVERLEFAGHRVEVHHRNEISAEQLAVAADALPCVLGRDGADGADGSWQIWVSAAELAACDGVVACLADKLDQAIANRAAT